MKHILDDLTNSEIERLINERIHSERNRQMLKRRLIDGLLFRELEEEFDLSFRQCQRIVANCMCRLEDGP